MVFDTPRKSKCKTIPDLPHWLVALVTIVSLVPSCLILLGYSILPDTLSAVSTGYLVLVSSAVVVALVTGTLSLLHFNIRNEAVTLVIGLLLLGSGLLDTIEILVHFYFASEPIYLTLLYFSWIVSRLFNSSVLIIGAALLIFGIYRLSKIRFVLATVSVLIFILLAAVGFRTVLSLPENIELNLNQLVAKPYEFMPFIFYAIAGLYILPKLRSISLNYFTTALIIATVPSILAEAHVIIASTEIFDAHFHAAHLLKIFAYFILLLGLYYDYRQTHLTNLQAINSLELTQHQLQERKINLERINKDLENEIRERQETENELLRRLELDNLISFLSTIFLQLPDEETDIGIRQSIEEIGRFTQVDIVAVLLAKQDGSIKLSHEWSASNTYSLRNAFDSSKVQDFAWGFAELSAFKPLIITDASQLPSEAEYEQILLRKNRIESLIATPMITGGKFMGTLIVGTVGKKTSWSSPTVSLLQLVAEMFANSITRLQAQKRLDEQRNFLRHVIDSDPNFIFAKDINGRFTLVNQAVADAYGTSVDNLIGKTDADFNDNAAEVEHFRKIDLEVIEKQIEIVIPEEKITDAQGNIRWLQTVKRPLINSSNEPEVLGVSTDITRRKQAEDQIHEQAALLDKTQDGILVTNLDGKIVFWNKGAERLYGWNAKEVIGKDFRTLLFRDPNRIPKDLKRVLPKLSEWRTEQEHRTKSAKSIVVETRWSVVRNSQAEPTSLLIVNTDISERKRWDEELLRATKLESIGILAGGIAHDFNNILTGILGNASLALISEHDTSQKQRLESIEKASRRAQELTQQLLTFAKGGAPVKKVASVEELIGESIELMLRGSNVKVDITVAPDLYPVEVDCGQISQVFNNLVINAAQAMPTGGTISLTLSNFFGVPPEYLGKSEFPSREYVKIEFRDEGHGIPASHLQKIFDPYFSTKAKGSGLGLATSYSIIKRHQGFITVDSALGKGTTFTVYLPASEEKLVELSEQEEPLLIGGGRILVMDDDAIVREILGNMLVHLGYEVAFACDGKEAIMRYQQAMKTDSPFKLLIADLTIPGGLGGREMLSQLLEIDPNATAIATSGYSNDPVMADHQRFGFKGILIKPFEIEHLKKILTRHANTTTKSVATQAAAHESHASR